jgi:hypothetical protein
MNEIWQEAFFWVIGIGVATVGTINGWAISKLVGLERELERKADRHEVPNLKYLEEKFKRLEEKIDRLNGVHQ